MRALVLEADWDPRPSYRPSYAEERGRKALVGSEVWRRPRASLTVVPDPSPAADEVVLAVRAVGVCGSDTHCIETDSEGYLLFSGPSRLPVILGHEYAGEVVAVGSAVQHLAVGDLVAAEGMLNCGVCEACRRGLPNQCPALEMVGFSSPGAYAELIAVRERYCWKVDSLLRRYGSPERALEVAALVEPIACSYNGLFVAAGGMAPGSHVAVWGCGPIGLCAVMLARTAGAASILAFDRSAERCALAVRLGADEAFPLDDLARQGTTPPAVIRDRTGGWGVDMQVEAAGAADQTMPMIEASFAPAGRMVYLGRTGQRAPVLLDALVSARAGIVGSRGHAGGGCFPAILRLLTAGRMDPWPMITARFGFGEVLEAIDRSRSRTDGKIMVRVP
jgi:scyllo-inosose 3-dehydrogenase